MPDEEIKPEIHKGIPLRVGACRCVLGTLRNDPDVVEATEDLNNHDNVTGCSARDPKHIVKITTVKYPPDDKGYPYFTAMSPWSNYPRTIGTGTLANEDTHLVIKARGKLKKGGDGVWLFPKVKLTIRPVSSKLEYKWISDAVANQNVDATTEFGGGYEETVYGESIGMDFDYLYGYQVPTVQQPDDDGEGYKNALSDLLSQYTERGLPIELEGEFYYKNSDMPDGLHQQYAPPLQPWEIDLNLYPHAEGEANYDLKMNESWDLRYRFPLWYPTYGGVPNWTTATGYTYGKWNWTPATNVFPSTNPFLKKAPTIPTVPPTPAVSDRYYNGIPNHLVPVEKYLRIQEGSLAQFPLIISNSANQTAVHPAFYVLHKDKHMQIVTKVRKRYPFSFQMNANSTSSKTFKVLDQNPANIFYRLQDGYSEEDGVYYAFSISGDVMFRGTDPNYYPDALNGVERYKCQSWWRMEIEAEACEWNYNEKLGKGWTIKGKIYFAKKILATFSTAGGGVATPSGVAPLSGAAFYLNASPSEGLYGVSSFGFWRPEDTLYDTLAGEADFSVTISPANATGGKVKVFDFPIGGKSYVPNEAGDGMTPQFWGDEAENSINYIQDFVITEIIPPTQG